MKCIKCNKDIPDTAKFCPYCQAATGLANGKPNGQSGLHVSNNLQPNATVPKNLDESGQFAGNNIPRNTDESGQFTRNNIPKNPNESGQFTGNNIPRNPDESGQFTGNNIPRNSDESGQFTRNNIPRNPDESGQFNYTNTMPVNNGTNFGGENTSGGTGASDVNDFSGSYGSTDGGGAVTGGETTVVKKVDRRPLIGILSAAAFILIVGVVCLLLFFFRPMKQLEDLLDDGNYAEAVDYINDGNFSGSDLTTVKSMLEDIYQQIYDDYYIETTDYETAKSDLETFEPLESEKLKESYTLYDERLDKLHTSRENYAQALTDWEEEDYASALTRLRAIDENVDKLYYDKAQEQIELVREDYKAHAFDEAEEHISYGEYSEAYTVLYNFKNSESEFKNDEDVMTECDERIAACLEEWIEKTGRK